MSVILILLMLPAVRDARRHKRAASQGYQILKPTKPVYRILWEALPAAAGIHEIEN